MTSFRTHKSICALYITHTILQIIQNIQSSQLDSLLLTTHNKIGLQSDYVVKSLSRSFHLNISIWPYETIILPLIMAINHNQEKCPERHAYHLGDVLPVLIKIDFDL